MATEDSGIPDSKFLTTAKRIYLQHDGLEYVLEFGSLHGGPSTWILSSYKDKVLQTELQPLDRGVEVSMSQLVSYIEQLLTPTLAATLANDFAASYPGIVS